MKIGISLDGYVHSNDAVEAVRRLSRIGFDAVDFDFFNYMHETSILSGSNWRESVLSIRRAADDSGIAFCQLHSPMGRYMDDRRDADREWQMMVRSFETCSMLGAPWAVVHSTRRRAGITRETYAETLEFNISRIQSLCDQAKAFGVGIALENLLPFGDDLAKDGVNQITDVITVVDRCARDNLCACLDTGHAFCSGIRPSDAARLLGNRLKVLHIHDNDGSGDQHLAPFIGKIDWADFMVALNEIRYSGVFSLEIENYIKNLPPELVDEGVSLAYRIAQYLLKA